MRPVNKFRLVHSYEQLVGEGKAAPIMCVMEHGRAITALDDDKSDEPIFKCPVCLSTQRLGSDVWDQIQLVVNNGKFTNNNF